MPAPISKSSRSRTITRGSGERRWTGFPSCLPSDAAPKHAVRCSVRRGRVAPEFVAADGNAARSNCGRSIAAPLHFPLLFWRHPDTVSSLFFLGSSREPAAARNDIIAAFDLAPRRASCQRLSRRFNYVCGRISTASALPFRANSIFLARFLSDHAGVLCRLRLVYRRHDSIFVLHTNDRFRKVIAFEADPAVMSGLQRFVRNMDPRAVLHNAAVGGHNGVVHFAGDGIGGGRITDAASTTGTAVTASALTMPWRTNTSLSSKWISKARELQALEGRAPRHLARPPGPRRLRLSQAGPSLARARLAEDAGARFSALPSFALRRRTRHRLLRRPAGAPDSVAAVNQQARRNLQTNRAPRHKVPFS